MAEARRSALVPPLRAGESAGRRRSSTISPGTRLIFAEQGVFLDGYDDAAGREQGTRWLLDKLGESLREPAHA